MMPFRALPCLLTLFLPAASLQATTVVRSSPSLADVAEIASVAEELGRLYKTAAGRTPSFEEQRLAVASASKAFRGSLEKDVASQIIDQSDACVGCGRQSKQPSFLTSARQQHQGLQPIVNIIADPPSESDFNEAVGFLQSRRHTGSDAPRDAVRPKALGSELSPGSEPAGLYERKTQSPLVWLNLLKPEFPKTGGLWSDVSYGADAAKALKKVRAEIEELRR